MILLNDHAICTSCCAAIMLPAHRGPVCSEHAAEFRGGTARFHLAHFVIAPAPGEIGDAATNPEHRVCCTMLKQIVSPRRPERSLGKFAS